ncbi:MAG: helix-turn-helix transcriptional regulator [Clostridia bacterium]|nr:helix-turn-helix transcriptional regulator [Clostridia bacterium]
MEFNLEKSLYVDNTLKEMVVHRNGLLPLKTYRSVSVYYHWHEEYEFILHTADGICLINGQKYNLSAGDALLIQGNELHTRNPDAQFSRSMISIVFHPDFINGSKIYNTDILGKLQFQRYFSQTDPVDREVIALLNEVLYCEQRKEPYYEYELQMTLSYIFTLLLKHHRYSSIPKKTVAPAPTSFINLLSHIQENLDKPMTLVELSEYTHFSIPYIIKLFKKYTLQTPIDYIKSCRLEAAGLKLIHTDKTEIEIAEECGFQSISYFIRSFKERNKLTPGEFRKQYKY